MSEFSTIKHEKIKALSSIERLDDLLFPLNSDEFFEQYWERKPLHISRNQESYFASLLSIKEVESILGSRLLREGDMRISKNGKLEDFANLRHKEGFIDRNKVVQLYHSGSTLILEHLNRYHDALGEMIQNLQSETHLGLRTNVYLTPARSTGFARHWDTHDVLILQVEGTKRWKIYSNPIELPTDWQTKHQKKLLSKTATLVHEVDLQPGDVLYLPRGFVHSASANEQATLHITMGMRSHTVQHLFSCAMEAICQSDVALRKALMLKKPMDQQQLKDIFISAVQQTDLEKAKDCLHESFVKSRIPSVRNRLTMSEPETIDISTLMHIKSNAVYRFFYDENQIVISFDGKFVKLPKGAEPALRHIETTRVFAVDSIPGLDEPSRLLLARRLYQEGLLNIDEAKNYA